MKNNYFKKTKMGLSALLFFVCLLFANGIQAQDTYTWTGATSSDWDDAGNWTKVGANTPNTIPGIAGGSLDIVTISTNAVNQCNMAITHTIARILVGSATPIQGILNISSGATLNANNSVAGNSSIIITGGKINNSGTIKTNPTTPNTSGGLFINASAFAQNATGVFGAGILDINSRGNTIGCNANATLSFGTGSVVTALALKNAITVGGTGVGQTGNLLITGAGFTSNTPLYSTCFLIQSAVATAAVVTIDTGTSIAINSTTSRHFVTLATEFPTKFINNGTISLTGTWNTCLRSSAVGVGSSVFENNGSFTASFTGGTNGIYLHTGTDHIITNTGTLDITVSVGAPLLLTKVLTGTNTGTINLSGGTAVSQLGATTSFTNSGSGTINLNGLTIPTGASFINNSGTSLTIAERKILTNSGTLTNNGDLILKSSASGTGSLLSSTSINNVTQQRYLTSVQRGWRLLSNPVSTVTYGTVATASTTPLTLGNGTAKTYDSATGLWTISNTDNLQNWTTKTAVSLFVRGRTSEVTSTTYSVLPPSNVTVSVKGTATNAAPTAIVTTLGEYYLVANPYTAPVSVSSIITASTGLSNTISYYNPNNGSDGGNTTTGLIGKFGGYDTPSVSGAAGSATDVVIPPMGAIFVQASSAGTINVLKTAIFTGTPLQAGTYTHKTAQATVASTNALKIEVNSGGTYYDTVALQFKAVGDAGSNIDFGKLPNSILDAYSFSGANKMSVSELELVAQTIPLGITSTIQKSYTFKVIDNTIPVGFEAVLVDNLLNTNTILVPGTNYNFVIDSTPASQGDSRFAINLRTAGTLGVIANELEAKIQVYPNPSRGQFNISNTLEDAATIEISSLNGQVVHSQKLNSGTTTIQTKSWATGVYILKATNNGTQTTKKLIIQ